MVLCCVLELIRCDGRDCNKVYHVECVNEDANTLPLIWYCSHCSVCKAPDATVRRGGDVVSSKADTKEKTDLNAQSGVSEKCVYYTRERLPPVTNEGPELTSDKLAEATEKQPHRYRLPILLGHPCGLAVAQASFPPGTRTGNSASSTAAPTSKEPAMASKQGAEWSEHYSKLQAYHAHNHHCNIPQGYTADPAFGRWVCDQRIALKNGRLKPQRVARLNAIGFQSCRSAKYGTDITLS